MASPTQPSANNKFSDRPMFGNGHIHAYGVRVPEVQFDKPHLTNPSNGLAPPLPSPPNTAYSPNSPRSSQESPKPVGAAPENLGYPGMLQAVAHLYDYIVKASNPMMQQPGPQQQQQQQQTPQPPVPGYPIQQPYQPQPQQWGESKAIGAPILGFSPYYNGSWGGGGWGGPGPAV